MFAAMGVAGLPQADVQAELSSATSFDVASLKPARPTPPYPVVLGITVNGTTTLTDVTLVQALMFAFGITASNQIPSPAWTRDATALFDIAGKAPGDASRQGPPDDAELTRGPIQAHATSRTA